MKSLLKPGYELDKLLVVGMFFTTLANFQNFVFFTFIYLIHLKEVGCPNFHSARFFPWVLMNCRARNIFVRVVLFPSDCLIRLHLSDCVVSKTNQNDPSSSRMAEMILQFEYFSG